MGALIRSGVSPGPRTGHHGAMTQRAPSGRALASAAKSALAARLSTDPDVVGVGLARRSGTYVVKVDLADAGAARRVPGNVDGVRVVTEVIGAVRPL
jgi:hypothetical protein